MNCLSPKQKGMRLLFNLRGHIDTIEVRPVRSSYPNSWNFTQNVHQAILVVSTVLGSWLGMQAAHELGHVLGALLTGGKIATVVLHPLTISRTELIDNPHPLIVVWGGPLVGVMLPLALWGLLEWTRVPGAFVARFFAGRFVQSIVSYFSFVCFECFVVKSSSFLSGCGSANGKSTGRSFRGFAASRIGVRVPVLAGRAQTLPRLDGAFFVNDPRQG